MTSCSLVLLRFQLLSMPSPLLPPYLQGKSSSCPTYRNVCSHPSSLHHDSRGSPPPSRSLVLLVSACSVIATLRRVGAWLCLSFIPTSSKRILHRRRETVPRTRGWWELDQTASVAFSAFCVSRIFPVNSIKPEFWHGMKKLTLPGCLTLG